MICEGQALALGPVRLRAAEAPRTSVISELEAPPPQLWWATGTERPIFHDPSGRRGRLLLTSGLLAIVASLCAVAALVMGAIGFSHLPPLPAAPGALSAARAPAPAHATRAPHRTLLARHSAPRRAHPPALLVAQLPGVPANAR